MPKKNTLTLADVRYYADKVTGMLRDDLRVKVEPVNPTVAALNYSKSVKFFVELHDRKGRCCDLYLAANLPRAFDYIKAMETTLMIVGREGRGLPK